MKWDNPLPSDLVRDMISFFIDLFELESPRSLLPKKHKTIGKPDLVVFSDQSVVAYGSVSYIRWKLESGKWWTMLILSKSKIAPKSRLTIPRLELNGAVLSKRLDDFVMSSLKLEFENVYHIVDSSTVLGYVHKPDAKLKPFEGIRVSEIQTAGVITDGRLHNWFWVDGENNPADWETKPRAVAELEQGGFWQKGPKFLEEDISTWPIRKDFRTDKLEGEITPKSVHIVLNVSIEVEDALNDYFPSFQTLKSWFA